jgi:hypothetical protein
VAAPTTKHHRRHAHAAKTTAPVPATTPAAPGN